MSALVVMTPAELTVLIDAVVRKAFDDAGRPSSSSEYAPRKSCGVPQSVAKRLVKQGKVRGCVLGREAYVHVADLAAWVESQAMDKRSDEPAVEVPEPADEFEMARQRAKLRRTA